MLDVRLESRWEKDLQASCIRIIETIAALEDEFDVCFTEDEVIRITTVQDALDAVLNSLRGPPSASITTVKSCRMKVTHPSCKDWLQ